MQQIRQLTKADYGDIFALSQFAFQYELSEAALAKKEEEANRHAIWGWMVDEQLAAKMHIVPLSCYIHEREFAMGGISSVATWPEHRRKGLVKDLLYHGLEQMKKNGQTLSFLHPFSVPFYRKFGWELTFTEKHYSIPIEKLRGSWNPAGYVRRIHRDIPLLHKIYSSYAKKFSGTLIRDEKWWEQRVLKDDQHIAVAYNEKNHAEGYVIYRVKNNTFSVSEIAYTSINGWKLLLQFITNHDSMVEKIDMVAPESDHLSLLVDEPRFEQRIIPYFMARIVDVLTFLKKYPFENKLSDDNLVLHVEDSFFQQNSGTYQLDREGNIERIHVNQTDAKVGVHCTIQMLTSMFLGYKRPFELYQVGLVKGDERSVSELEQMIPNQQPFFADFF
ncbi:GNAT family N-acetyltransferase [Virgibacillus alimentarius]|uniref:GNAT family N-acetyltransferase n=1 Tax=Virgibacillus alimentarius TaxID=698769 RepID=UPI0004931B57|nr:GNAT family N-acetyltransferase [Virgibacillus alimentarius]